MNLYSHQQPFKLFEVNVGLSQTNWKTVLQFQEVSSCKNTRYTYY